MAFKYINLIMSIFLSLSAFSQNVKSIDKAESSSEVTQFNKDARFFRPTILTHKSHQGTFSLGGYMEANTQYLGTDGESDGLSLQFQQIHIIAQSTWHNDRLHFITDINFNPETQQFNITESALNIKFHEAINLRGGVILPPLGYFNQYGEGPVTTFVDYPLVSTSIIPTRFSEIGFGLQGSINIPSQENLALSYESYLVRGFQDGVVDNDMPRTSIPLGKPDHVFNEDNNNKLAFTGRVAILHQEIGEVGLSYYTGAYNSTEVDEIEIDESRKLSILAMDGQFKFLKMSLKTELAFANVDIYEGLGQLYGTRQLGYHIELSYPILENIHLLGQDDNKLNIAFRVGKADFNVDNFEQTETKIYDEVTSLRGGLGFHLSNTTVVKANYSYFCEKDILGNEAKSGSIQFGIATYF